MQFADELPMLTSIKIPRLIVHPDFTSISILGFADASEKGYGAVLYHRQVDRQNVVSIYLIKAKTKVAPLLH